MSDQGLDFDSDDSVKDPDFTEPVPKRKLKNLTKKPSILHREYVNMEKERYKTVINYMIPGH